MTLSMPWKAVKLFLVEFWAIRPCEDCGSATTWLNECNEVVCNDCNHVHTMISGQRNPAEAPSTGAVSARFSLKPLTRSSIRGDRHVARTTLRG